MIFRFARICAIAMALALSISYSTRAEEARKAPHIWVRDVLNHADDLSLTSDQKAKLGDLIDAGAPKNKADYAKLKDKVQSILSKDQWEKVEGVFKKMKEDRERAHADDNDDHK